MNLAIKMLLILFLLISISSFKASHTFNSSISYYPRMIADTTEIDSSVYILTPFRKNVHASYYHDKFTGRSTASGEIFDNNLYTAAHKTLKFGTLLKVTNTVNGASVIVVVNDRGPFVKGREIDLSKKAFFEIAKYKERGFLIVDIEIIED